MPRSRCSASRNMQLRSVPAWGLCASFCSVSVPPNISQIAKHEYGMNAWCQRCKAGGTISRTEIEAVAQRAPWMTSEGMSRHWACKSCGEPSELHLASPSGVMTKGA